MTIHILPNVPPSKDNQTMKLGEGTRIQQEKIFFFKSYAENDAGRLGPNLFFFSKNTLHDVKASGLQLSFNIFR